MSDEQHSLVKDLISTGTIPFINENDIPPSQASIIYILHQQNLSQAETNRIIFGKLDKAAEVAQEAKEKAVEAAEKAADAARTGVEIKDQFILLNGKTSKTIERVVTLEDEKKRRLEEEVKKELIKQGMLIIPRKISNYLKGAGKIAVALSSLFGVCAILYPFLLWFIGVAFHVSIVSK